MFKGEKVLLRASRCEDMQPQWELENDPELWFWDGHTPRPTSLESLLAHYDESGRKKPGNLLTVIISHAMKPEARHQTYQLTRIIG